MTQLDDPLARLLADDGAAIDPAPGFRVELYERLAGRAGYRGRARPALAQVAQLRPLILLALVALAAVIGSLLVGRQLLAPSPAELAARSIELYARPPAFRATVVAPVGAAPAIVPSGEASVATDGAGTWRVELTRSSEAPTDGSYAVWSAAVGGGIWNAGTGSWTPLGADDGPPWPLTTELFWSGGPADLGAPGRAWHPGSLGCADPRPAPGALVAGRPAVGVRCAERDMTYWVDDATSLVLAVRAGEHAPGWDPDVGMAMTSFEAAPDVDPALFAIEPPVDAAKPGWPARLAVGEPLPAWSAPTLDGTEVGTETLRGRPTLLTLWASWCPPCVDDTLPLLAAVDGRDDVQLVLVASPDEPAGVERAVGDTLRRSAIVVDTTGDLGRTFGTTAVPALVFVDAAGIVQAVSIGAVDPDALSQALDDLVAGRQPALTPASPR